MRRFVPFLASHEACRRQDELGFGAMELPTDLGIGQPGVERQQRGADPLDGQRKNNPGGRGHGPQGDDIAWSNAERDQARCRHEHVSFTSGPVPHALWSVFLVVALFGIVGMGIGALLRNQIVAVAVGVIFLLVLEGIVAVIPKVDVVYPYLPGGASNAIMETGNGQISDSIHLLSPAAGIVVLLLWAFVPAVLGASITMNRDIT